MSLQHHPFQNQSIMFWHIVPWRQVHMHNFNSFMSWWFHKVIVFSCCFHILLQALILKFLKTYKARCFVVYFRNTGNLILFLPFNLRLQWTYFGILLQGLPHLGKREQIDFSFIKLQVKARENLGDFRSFLSFYK
jgi:hypothetical protein